MKNCDRCESIRVTEQTTDLFVTEFLCFACGYYILSLNGNHNAEIVKEAEVIQRGMEIRERRRKYDERY